jgi:exonuclease VII small subunit
MRHGEGHTLHFEADSLAELENHVENLQQAKQKLEAT